MPYANEGQISTSPIAGGVSITTQQYQQALAGMSEGKLVTIAGGFAVIDPPEPEPEPEPEPTVEEQRAQWAATAVQIKIALDEIGRLDEVETIVAASSRRTQIAWENATHLRRLSPAMVDLTEGSNPPLTDEQLDDVFQLAMSIEI